MAHMYIVPSLLDVVEGDDVHVLGSEAHHAAAVGRVRVGEDMLLTDGEGVIVSGTVLSASKSAVTVRVDSTQKYAQPRLEVVLVQALAKGDRDERAVEMATELGVTTIFPWQAARSVSRWDKEKASKGQLRWQNIVREASKQSLRAWIPEVGELCMLSDLAHMASENLLLVLDPTATDSVTDLVPAMSLHQRVLVVVGPEGGITPDEIQHLVDAGARRVRMGNHVMRTSTAGPVAIALVNELSGRWND